MDRFNLDCTSSTSHRQRLGAQTQAAYLMIQVQAALDTPAVFMAVLLITAIGVLLYLLVLMDEPFGALDALTREKMNLEMLRIRERSGKTFIIVTHSIQEAVFLGSRCAVLTAGPARMADCFDIALQEPRNLHVKTSAEFGVYVKRIYDLLGVD